MNCITNNSGISAILTNDESITVIGLLLSHCVSIIVIEANDNVLTRKIIQSAGYLFIKRRSKRSHISGLVDGDNIGLDHVSFIIITNDHYIGSTSFTIIGLGLELNAFDVIIGNTQPIIFGFVTIGINEEHIKIGFSGQIFIGDSQESSCLFTCKIDCLRSDGDGRLSALRTLELGDLTVIIEFINFSV